MDCTNIILIGLLTVQLSYYIFLFSRLAVYKKTSSINSYTEPVSVIICAKNELANLQKNLPKILSQDYSDFQVIIVDDQSIDYTFEWLNEIKNSYKNLSVFQSDKNSELKGKKNALNLGITAAQHDLILLTDADCRPIGDHWLKNMADNFQVNNIVLGYGPMEKFGKEKAHIWSAIINKFIRYDTFFIAIQYFSYALAGIPYMGVGRNMGYKKQLFLENNGFDNINKTLSGDDDLFVSKAAEKKQVDIEINEQTFMYSRAKTSISDWMRQKQRHHSTATQYKWIHQLLLAVYWVSLAGFYVTLMMQIFRGFLIAGIILWSLKILVQMLIFYHIAKRLKEQDLIKYIPLFDYISFVFYIILAMKLICKESKEWN